jgi:putative addiction module antidote
MPLVGSQCPFDPAQTDLYNEYYIEIEAAMMRFKVTTVGASAGFILTKEAMARMKIQKGDSVYLTEAPDGGYRLTPFNPEFERQMSLAEDIMHEDRDILRALSK